MRRLRLFLATCGVSLSVAGAALAQSPGELDPAFGLEAGLTATVMPKPASGGDVVAMADGGWVVSASIREPDGLSAHPALMRYTARGIPVASFGVNGVVTASVKIDSGAVLPVLSDGTRLYQVVMARPQLHVLAYTLQGQPDLTYGNAGIATVIAGEDGFPFIDAVLQSGRVLIASSGNDGVSATDSQFLLARFTPSGQPDSTFAAGGRRFFELLSGDNARNIFTSVTLQADGKIVAGGRIRKPLSDYDMVVARFDSNGELDTTFGSGGFRAFSLVEDDFGREVAVQGDGKVVIAGTICSNVQSPALTDFCMLGATRLLPNGEFDPSFGGGGRAMHWLPPIDGQPAKYVSVLGLVSDPQGRLLLLGSMSSPTDGAPSSAFLARLTSDGSLDSSFGTGGVVRDSYGAASSSFMLAGRLVQLPSGAFRAISVGSREVANTWSIVIARHLYDGSIPTTAK